MYHNIFSALNARVNQEQCVRHDRGDWFERAALGASFLCLLHCIALPLLLAALPVLSRSLNVSESFHAWLLVFALPTSALALFTGRARHGALMPLLLGAAGLTALSIGAFPWRDMTAGTWITVVGSLALIAGHTLNWRLRHNGHVHA